MNRGVLLFLGLLLVSAPLLGQEQQAPDPVELVIGAPAGAPLEGAQLDAELERVASVLRCPVCQGLSISDSPAEMAVNMKHQVREMLERGYTGEQAIQYYELTYGEFVRLEPKREGLNWLVWLAPLAALIAGVVLVMRALQRNVRIQPAETVDAVELEPIPDDLRPWVDRVREMVAEERMS